MVICRIVDIETSKVLHSVNQRRKGNIDEVIDLMPLVADELLKRKIQPPIPTTPEPVEEKPQEEIIKIIEPVREEPKKVVTTIPEPARRSSKASQPHKLYFSALDDLISLTSNSIIGERGDLRAILASRYFNAKNRFDRDGEKQSSNYDNHVYNISFYGSFNINPE